MVKTIKEERLRWILLLVTRTAGYILIVATSAITLPISIPFTIWKIRVEESVPEAEADGLSKFIMAIEILLWPASLPAWIKEKCQKILKKKGIISNSLF